MLSKRKQKTQPAKAPLTKREAPQRELGATSRNLLRSTSQSKSQSKKSRRYELKRIDSTDNTLHPQRSSMDKTSVTRQLMDMQTSYADLLKKHNATVKENSELKKECRELRSKYHESQQSKLSDQIKIKTLLEQNRQAARTKEELQQCKNQLRETEQRLTKESDQLQTIKAEKEAWTQLKSRLLRQYEEMLQELDNIRAECNGD